MQPRTRIVCTLGPASDSDQVVRAMIHAGMDVARINFSHGDHTTHAARIARVRRLAHEENAMVAILGDLQGPKIRIGNLGQGSAQLKPGALFTLTTHTVDGDASVASVDFADLPQAVHAGGRILLDDGAIELRVVSTDATNVVTHIVTGGELNPHKGVNLPGVPLKVSALTDKDHADLEFAVEQDVDYLALSFVRSAADVHALRQRLAARDASIPVIAKIEKCEAIANFDAILEASDGVMVARGDLGVEAAPERVPIYQKTIICKANAAGKPVITATQMLESMLHSQRPTRAEASDVANAILDGTDAVMLSGETAVGKYPIEAVETMARIAEAVEESVQFRAWQRDSDDTASCITDAIGNATCEIAKQLGAKVIVTSTFSGFTARMIARHRPLIPIFAVTPSERTYRRLALVWGVRSTLLARAETPEALIEQGLGAASAQGIVQAGDLAVITAGVPAGVPGRTNMIQVRVVGK